MAGFSDQSTWIWQPPLPTHPSCFFLSESVTRPSDGCIFVARRSSRFSFALPAGIATFAAGAGAADEAAVGALAEVADVVVSTEVLAVEAEQAAAVRGAAAVGRAGSKEKRDVAAASGLK